MLQYTATEGLAIIGGLIILLLFLINLPLIIVIIVGKLRNLESKFNINNTDAFKSDDYLKMNSIISTIQGILIIALLTLGIWGGSTAGFASAGSSNDPFLGLILIVPYIQWAIIILICAEILLLILERSRKRTNLFKNLFQDYALFYEKNDVAIAGRCQICSRAIPYYYSLDKNLHSEFLTKNNVCFQADGQHIVTTQNQQSNSFFLEYKKLYNKIKSTWNFWFYAYIISLFYYIVMAILLSNYIGPGIVESLVSSGTSDYYYMILMVQGIAPPIAATLLIPANFIGKYAQNSLIIKRLYFDNFYEETKEALENNAKLPMNFILPPDYNKPGDKLPSFIETLKQARGMAKNIQSITTDVTSLKDVKNVVQLAQSVKGASQGIIETRSDIKDFVEEHTTGSYTSETKESFNPIQQPTESELGAKNERIDSLEEIKKLKELLDIGAITEDEFKTKKSQILDKF